AGKKLLMAVYDFVIEATGSSEGLKQAVRMARPRVIVVMKSTVHGLVAIDTAPIVINEITLIGSRCERFEPAIALLKAGRINLDDMISAEFSLAEAAKAFRVASARGVLKVLLRN